MSERQWRIGSHYGIHVYEVSEDGNDIPVCTAMTVAHARQIVKDHNARPMADPEAWPLGMRATLTTRNTSHSARRTPGGWITDCRSSFPWFGTETGMAPTWVIDDRAVTCPKCLDAHPAEEG